MKITGIRLDRLRHDLDPPFHAAWDPVGRRQVEATVVRVETDEGLIGIGSGDTMNGFEAWEQHFLGTDPLRITRQVRVLESIAFHDRRYWPLEAALWDLAGKAYGVPVATLMGGATDRLRAYASTGAALGPQERVAAALAAREHGFTAMKLRIDRNRPDAGLAAVRAVREALGPEFTLMVDLNQAWRMAGDVGPGLDRVAVRRLVAALAELDVHWVEEPLPYADLDGLRELRSAGVRIAAGEMVPTYDDAVRLLEADVLDVYQPDCVLVLGLLRSRAFAEQVLHRHRRFTPHSWTNGIGLLANLHVCAGVGGGPWFEVPFDPPGWSPQRRDFMLAEPIGIDADGCIRVPSRPGLGVELDEQAIDRGRVR